MASENTSTGPAFPVGLVGGLVAAVVIIAVAWATMGAEVAIPILILVVICVVVALVYRTMGSGGKRAETDSSEGGLPRLPTDDQRPLGDTASAHDEINPHDLPPDHPGRHAAEEMAQGGETAGMSEGGAAGAGGSEQGGGGKAEPQGEAKQGASTTD